MALDSIIWVDAAGVQTALNDHDAAWSTRARDGFWSPPFQINSSEYPQQPGSVFNFVKTGERVVNLPVEVRAADHMTLTTLYRNLAYRLNPERGAGRLRMSMNDSKYERELICRPGGLVKVAERENTASLILTFLANDPYWYDVNQSSASFTLNQAAAFFPIFPIVLVNSSSFATANIDNTGNVETWPVWTVNGPASNVIITRSDGKKIDLTGVSLTSAEWLIIDTAAKTIKKEDPQTSVSVLEYLSLDSSLFSLSPGTNNLTIQLSDPVYGATMVTAAYYLRWLTP